MTTLQKLEVEASELRDQLNALAGDADADEEKIGELTAKYRKVEARRRAAIIAEGEPETRTETTPGDAETRERDRLVRRANLSRFVAAAHGGTNVTDGVEAEVRAAFDVPETGAGGGVNVPWALLEDREPETRADAVTSTVPADERPHRTVLSRVFAGSIIDYLGVRPAMVPTGEASYAVVTGGASPAPVAAGDAADAVAATITGETLAPLRVSTAYRWRLENAATFGGLEDVLRADIRAAMTDKLSDVVLNGNGTAPNPEGFLKALNVPGTVPNAAATYTAFLAAAYGAVDGKYANMTREVRLLVGVESYRRAGEVVETTGGGDSAAVVVSRLAGGFRASAHIAAPATVSSTTNVQDALSFASNVRGSAVLPVWAALEMIRDPYTGAAQGEVRLQVVALYNFKVLRSAPWKRAYFKTA